MNLMSITGLCMANFATMVFYVIGSRFEVEMIPILIICVIPVWVGGLAMFLGNLKQGAKGRAAVVGAVAANLALGYQITSQSKQLYEMLFLSLCVGHAGLLAGAMWGGL